MWMQFPKLMKRIDPAGNYGISVINGANFTLMTAMGFMVPVNRRAWARGIQVHPAVLVDDDRGQAAMTEYDGGIILVDEADKLGMDEKKIVGEAALSKILGSHKLSARLGGDLRCQPYVGSIRFNA